MPPYLRWLGIHVELFQPTFSIRPSSGSTAEAGQDEPDARKQFALVPLDLGHHAARVFPRLGLVVEAVVEPLGPLRRPAHRTHEQMAERLASMGLRVQWREAEAGPQPAASGAAGT